MYKHIYKLYLFVCSFTLQAQDLSLIEGIWDRESSSTVKLFRIKDGALQEIASSGLNVHREFFLAFKPEKEGFYAIGTQDNVPGSHYIFWFKSGDYLKVKMENDGYQLLEGNTPENQALEKWHQFVQPLEKMAVKGVAGKRATYVDFFPLFQEKAAALTNLSLPKTSNRVFEERFKNFRTFDLLNSAVYFLYTPRAKQPGTDDFPDWFRMIDLRKLTETDDILSYPGAMNLIDKSVAILTRFDENMTAEKRKEIIYSPMNNFFACNGFADIGDDRVKGELVLYYARNIKTYQGMNEYQKSYSNYLITDDQRERMRKAILSQIKTTQGEPAIDFCFPDINGKEVALSDLKGKVVYIDVWATWCAPCKKEIPFLKQLEEELQGKEIVFLSISTDKSADYQRWKEFVKKEGLGGIQLFGGDRAREELMQPYHIAGIPRFILVDKKGHIVSDNAPRPSSNEVRLLLNATLSK